MTQTVSSLRARLPIVIAVIVACAGISALALGTAAAEGPAGSSAEIVPAAATPSPNPSASPGHDWTGPGAGDMRISGRHGGPGMREGGVFSEISITSIEGTRLSLATANGWTRTIDTAGVTITRDGKSVDVAALKVGDQISIKEARQTDGSFKVTDVVVIQPHVAGTVSAVAGDAITIKTFDGSSVTVHVGSSTSFEIAGKTNATIADVAVANLIEAEGARNTDGSLAATVVRVFTADQPRQGPGRMHDRDGWGDPGKPGSDPSATPAPSANPA